MLTTEGAPYTTDNEECKMDVADVDMTKWTEAEFEEKCTYIVKDHSWEGPLENVDLTCAEASLPRNLAFKHPPDSKEVRLAYCHILYGLTRDTLVQAFLSEKYHQIRQITGACHMPNNVIFAYECAYSRPV